MVKPHKPGELEMKVYPVGEPTPEGIKPVIVFSGIYVSVWFR
ncbi:hypothetical protein [Methanocaldococcus sp.]|nr:hypothetical protein [Methanocaldococcus sp.]